jgi:transposase-like protein
VLERRVAEPGNRSIIRETAEEFDVGEQSLRGWIRAYEKANAPAEEPTAAPVSETTPAAVPPVTAAAPAEVPTRRSPGRPAGTDTRVGELEAEVAKLRRDREALKSALAVLLSD